MNATEREEAAMIEAATDQGLDPVTGRLDAEEIDNHLDHDGGFLMVAIADAGHGLEIGISHEEPNELLCLYERDDRDRWEPIAATEVQGLDRVVEVIRALQGAPDRDAAVATFQRIADE